MTPTQNAAKSPSWATSLSLQEFLSFSAHLQTSSRIVAVLGAGLSAGSGIPTFRGADSSWRGFHPRDLSTPYCLRDDPVLFWHFYNYRRYLALKARPNRGHYALAKLAQLKPEFIAISQNVDDLSERAGHGAHSLLPIHGSLFNLECTNNHCDYAIHDHFSDHVIQDLDNGYDTNIADPSIELPPTSTSQLPRCTACQSLMRPAIVLFYERLYENTSERIDQWFDIGEVDLLLVIGTSAVVFPATEYIDRALESGARVALVDLSPPVRSANDSRFGKGHWYFHGDAAEVLPDMLRDVIGEL